MNTLPPTTGSLQKIPSTLFPESVARRFGLPVPLVIAICKTESSMDPWAMRFEPDFRWLWDVGRNRSYQVRDADRRNDRAPADFVAAPQSLLTAHTEWIGQQTSYGLMQVMGALAREQGFRGYFTELCYPELGCEIGCRYLVQLKAQHFDRQGWRGVVAAYNAGSPVIRDDGKGFVNQFYVDKVAGNGGFEGLGK